MKTHPALHQLLLFADSTQASATPEDSTSQSALGGFGIRFHGARSREHSGTEFKPSGTGYNANHRDPTGHNQVDKYR